MIQSLRYARRGANIVSQYQRVITYLLEKIDNGEYPPGSKLPSTQELMAELGASRATVDQAYRSLVERGRVESRVGAGRFVPRPDVSANHTGDDVP
jgi:DNA-binding GntR family transcriptional regulator